MADTTHRKRASILALLNHCQKSSREIAELVGSSQSTVSRIICSFENTGSALSKRKAKCGRKSKTSVRDDKMLLRLSIEDPRKTSSDLKRDMMDYGVHLSNSSIKKRLFQAGRIARRPKRKQRLTHKMKRKRLAWAKKYKNWTLDDWKKVLFSDLTHFVVGGKHVQYVRRSVGESVKPCHINQQVKHPAKKMFWGCFSFKGVGSLFPVQGMMKSDQYIEVIQRE